MKQESPSMDARPVRGGPSFSLHEKIDICRGLFAILVVVAHAFELACDLHPGWGESLPWMVRAILSYGSGTGVYYVMGFFVLSGYCIQASVSRLSRDGDFPLKTYMAARATRILPLYYVALLFTIGVEHVARTWLERPGVWSNGISRSVLVWQTLMVQNFTQTFGSFGASWSITNEVFYYIFFGLLAAICAPLRVRPAVVGMGLCVGIGVILQVAYRSGLRDPALMWTGLLFGLGVNWFLGALVAAFQSSVPRSPGLRRVAAAWPLIFALTMAMSISQQFLPEFVYMASGIAFTLMLIHFVIQEHDSPTVVPRAARRWVGLLGLSSYPMYLFHCQVLILVGAVVKMTGMEISWWLFWLAASLFTIVCCLPLGVLLERPLMNWRSGVMRRFKTTKSTREPVAGVRPALDVQR